MKTTMHTVEQVAEILDLHPKTIRRFIRDGRLTATKVGGQWRIKDTDLKKFTGENPDDILSEEGKKEDKNTKVGTSETPTPIRKIQVSAVVDIFVENKDEAMRISNTIFAVINCKDPDYGNSRCDFMYYENETKARFILWGTPRFISDLLACVSEISE